MGDFFPRALDGIAAMRDWKGESSSLPIHPRLLSAAQAKSERLRNRLRATCAEAAERLELAVAQVRVFVAECDGPGAKTILGDLEKALADIRSHAASELLDTSGIKSLARQLILANEDLKTLRDRSATNLPRVDGEGRGYG